MRKMCLEFVRDRREWVRQQEDELVARTRKLEDARDLRELEGVEKEAFCAFAAVTCARFYSLPMASPVDFDWSRLRPLLQDAGHWVVEGPQTMAAVVEACLSAEVSGYQKFVLRNTGPVEQRCPVQTGVGVKAVIAAVFTQNGDYWVPEVDGRGPCVTHYGLSDTNEFVVRKHYVLASEDAAWPKIDTPTFTFFHVHREQGVEGRYQEQRRQVTHLQERNLALSTEVTRWEEEARGLRRRYEEEREQATNELLRCRNDIEELKRSIGAAESAGVAQAAKANAELMAQLAAERQGSSETIERLTSQLQFKAQEADGYGQQLVAAETRRQAGDDELRRARRELEAQQAAIRHLEGLVHAHEAPGRVNALWGDDPPPGGAVAGPPQREVPMQQDMARQPVQPVAAQQQAMMPPPVQAREGDEPGKLTLTARMRGRATTPVGTRTKSHTPAEQQNNAGRKGSRDGTPARKAKADKGQTKLRIDYDGALHARLPEAGGAVSLSRSSLTPAENVPRDEAQQPQQPADQAAAVNDAAQGPADFRQVQ